MVGVVAVLPDVVGGGKNGFAAEGLIQGQAPAKTAAEIVRQALTGVVDVAYGNGHAGTGSGGVGWCRLHHWEKW